MECRSCGSANPSGVPFCRSCGARTDPPGADREPPAEPPTAERKPSVETPGFFSRHRIALLVSACLLVALGAGTATFALLSAGREKPAVRLEPIGYTSSDDFTANLDADVAAARRASEKADDLSVDEVPDPRESGTETVLAGQRVDSSDPGLYGGSRDTTVCDVRALIAFLEDPSNTEKRDAWADVLGISSDMIRSYVGDLTAVRLLYDTRVTNHGFADGEATTVQSLLQRGTAVLVDDRGVPRVKCDCGNPLLEPAGFEEEPGGDQALASDELISNPDESWRGFDPAQTVSVAPARQRLSALTIRDLDNPDGLLERPVGSDGASKTDTGTGDIKVTLSWSSSADLDLHVFEPDGPEIWYQHRGPTRSGGELDVDANVGCAYNGALENVFWPPGDAPSGEYLVEVYGYTVSGCGGGSYKLTIQVAGQEPEVHRGSVGQDEADSYSFDSAGSGFSFETEEPTEQGGSSEVSALTGSGLDELQVGMTRSEAEAAGFELQDQEGGLCSNVVGIPGVFVELGPDETITALGLTPETTIGTEAGLSIGDTTDQIDLLYGSDGVTQVGDDEASQGTDYLIDDGTGTIQVSTVDGEVVGLVATGEDDVPRVEFCA